MLDNLPTISLAIPTYFDPRDDPPDPLDRAASESGWGDGYSSSLALVRSWFSGFA
jgi:hypothetical protein